MSSTLIIKFMNGVTEEITFNGKWQYWCRTDHGLLLKSHIKGVWRCYPWSSIRNYENVPPEVDHGMDRPV
jgi:hypothetical protein